LHLLRPRIHGSHPGVIHIQILRFEINAGAEADISADLLLNRLATMPGSKVEQFRPM